MMLGKFYYKPLKNKIMSFELPKLGYEYNALEPHIDARTMEIHHSKHHNGYTNNLNNAITGTDMEGKTIEEICAAIGADKLIYQDLNDLIKAVYNENKNIKAFDTSCFDGKYITEGVTEEYLNNLHISR